MTLDPDRSLPDEVREACAWVAGEAELVRIAEGAIAAYAQGLTRPAGSEDPDPETWFAEGDREARAAFVICLNAINFGSGWWPTIRKRPGRSGYETVAAGIVEHFRAAGPWTPTQLADIQADAIAELLGQDADHPLMPQFAAALATLLSSWRAFADVSMYRGRPVPLFKRAQLAAADVERAGIATFPDRDRLTAFADNLVPHVLRVDGVLQLDRGLEQMIEAAELLAHGSAAEVELRACTVQAVELLAAACAGRLSPAEIDSALWTRGRDARYKAIPRPRSRNTAY